MPESEKIPIRKRTYFLCALDGKQLELVSGTYRSYYACPKHFAYGRELGEDVEEVLEDIMFGDPLIQNNNQSEPAIEIKEIRHNNLNYGIQFFNWDNDGDGKEIDECWAMFSDKQLAGQNIFNQSPYKNMNSLISEFKCKLHKYLPDDFDYQSHIGFLVYCAVQ